jgi:hypothetical protein
MGSSIIGIRYIGAKESQEDTVCKTGAHWFPGQVHNFATPLAERLLVHTDSFEVADIDMDGDTFMSAGKSQTRQGAAQFFNLGAMSVDQLVHMARFEFNRVIDPAGKDADQLRREVQTLMVNHSLDMDEDDRKAAAQPSGYVVPLIYQATPEEAAAIKAGELVLTLAPADKSAHAEDESLLIYQATPEEAQAVADGLAELRVVVIDSDADGAIDERLTADLDAMDKPALIDFAAARGIKVDARLSVEKLRLGIADAVAAA